MALTPAEVHNVAFKKPPIGKRGYDEEEVDAFLDIVEVELAKLIEENNELKTRPGGAPAGDNGESAKALAAARSELAGARDDNQRLQARIAELEKAAAAVASAPVGEDGAAQNIARLQQQLAAADQQLNDTKRQLAEQTQAAAQAQAAARQAQAAAQQAQQAQQAAPAGEANPADQHIKAVQVLALAQQTADQHLAESKAEAERLVNEARGSAQSQVADAQQRATHMVTEAENRAKQLDSDSSARAAQTVRDAEQRAATITAQFEQRKSALERRVEELRVYEREYRSRLRSYLESQLRDLDASGQGESSEDGSHSEGQG